VPIIFLSAKSLKEDVLEGFRSGADDYMTKPFNMEELIFRIEAILKRTNSQKERAQTSFEFGKFTFDAKCKELVFEDEIMHLTTKETDLLMLLARNGNNVLERNYALKTIWIDDNYFNARSMDVYITKLRKKLQKDPTVQILNVHGKGYKLIYPEKEQD
jgi:DNA-binding response OmpR family regulator